MTKDIRLSSATRASELPKPTFRSYGAPSPIVIDPNLPTPSERDRAIGYQWRMYELALFSDACKIDPASITFAGIKVELDKELEEGTNWLLKKYEEGWARNWDSSRFVNEYLGVPAPYTEVREFDKQPTDEERAEYNRRMGIEALQYKAQRSFRMEPRPWQLSTD